MQFPSECYGLPGGNATSCPFYINGNKGSVGFGSASSNKVNTFNDATIVFVSKDIQYLNDSVNGDSFIIKTPGLYFFNGQYSTSASPGTTTYAGLTVNTPDRTANIQELNPPYVMCFSVCGNYNQAAYVTTAFAGMRRCRAGDVITIQGTNPSGYAIGTSFYGCLVGP